MRCAREGDESQHTRVVAGEPGHGERCGDVAAEEKDAQTDILCFVGVYGDCDNKADQ